MWIEPLKNGKFKAVERYEDYRTGKQKKVSVTIEKNTAKNRKIAQAALAEKIREKSTEKAEDVSNITFGQLIDEYKKHQKENVKLSTYRRNCTSCNTFLKIFGEDTLMKRFSSKMIKDVLLATGKGPGTLNEYLRRLKSMLRWAYSNELIDDISYLDKVKSFKDIPKKEKIEDKFLESREVNILLEKMNPQWVDLTRFLVLTGLRIGEAIALDANDVDLKSRQIHVTKTYDTNNRIVTTPKTSRSFRDVYIQDELLPLCKSVKRESLMRRLVTGNDALFQNKKGNRIRIGVYTKHLKEDSKKYLNHEITPHALRHTHASLLFEQKISIDEICRRLGHEDSKVTREIYVHITNKLKEKDIEHVKSIKVL